MSEKKRGKRRAVDVVGSEEAVKSEAGEVVMPAANVSISPVYSFDGPSFTYARP